MVRDTVSDPMVTPILSQTQDFLEYFLCLDGLTDTMSVILVSRHTRVSSSTR